MPVRKGAFDKIDDNSFKSEAYKSLYEALKTTVKTCSFKKEPSFEGYYNKVYALYEKIRNIQKNLGARYDEGATYEQIVAEMDAAFNDVG